MDFNELKTGVKEIAEIAASVPEQFREKCFELLLSSLLEGNRANSNQKEKLDKGEGDTPKDEVPNKPKGVPGQIPITTQVRVLMRKTGVTTEQLEKILLFENGEVHFIKEPHPTGITTGQMEWALLLALKNAILKDSLSTDPEDVRSVCQEKGYYDKRNFASVFRADRNANLFRNALVPQGPAEPLTSEGQDALGALIKRLATEGEK